MKRLLCVALCLLLVCGVFIGCAQQPAPAPAPSADAPAPAASPEAPAPQTPKMAPGTYTGKAVGYARSEPITVSVKVSDTAIESIAIEGPNSETPPILQSVADLMIPRMIEHQSIAVDSITGATASSAGVKLAVSAALKEAFTAGGSDASAVNDLFRKDVPKKTDKQDLTTDILVVGMGGSGTAAAMRAAQTMHASDPAGVSVLAIDKAGKYGGTSANTSEMLAVNPPEFIKANNGGKDYMSKAAMRKAWLDYTMGDAKTEIIDIMLDNSGNAIDWLIRDFGFELSTPQRGFTPSDIYDCKYQYMPNDVGANKAETGKHYDDLYNKYTELGGKYLLETEAYELIYDQAANKVTGVKARNDDGTEYTITAKSVILATGGFAGNGEMEKQYLKNDYFPLKGEWYQLGMKQNDGKMIASAISIGAGTYNIGIAPMVHMSGTTTFLSGYPVQEIGGPLDPHNMTGRPDVWSVADLPLDLLVSSFSLAVNPKGERFTTEEEVGFLNPWIAGPTFYSIYSDEQIKKVETEGLPMTMFGPSINFLGHQGAIPGNRPLPETYQVIEDAIAAGIMVKADTLEALAAAIGTDSATLAKTVETYNGYVAAGKDEQFGKNPDFLQKIGAGPYYAIIGKPYCYSTCGGLDIDASFRVLQSDGKTPIGGLYAVGTDSMGVLFTEKKPYVTFGGAAQGWAYTSGYTAGAIVATELAK